MSETQTATVSHEMLSSTEVITEVQLGRIVAAVGNHEAKAIVLGGMVPGEGYGITGVHKLFLEPQGPSPVHKGQVTNQIQYCKDSFEQIGFVAKVKLSDTLKYEITAEGERLGKAIAGHLLDLSLRTPEFSLRQLFGMTKSNGLRGTRPPGDHLRIYRVLDESSDLETGRISEEAEVPYATLAHDLRWMDSNGIIKYHTINSRQIGKQPAATNKLGGKRRSDIEVTAKGKPVVHAIVSISNKILEGDEKFIIEGKNKLSRILADEDAVKLLVRKAYQNSPEANQVPRKERFERVAAYLLSHQVAPSREIKAALATHGITELSARATLRLMGKQGLLESVTIEGEKVWALPPDTGDK